MVGARVKRLPSQVYWNGLLTFGILRRDIGPHQLRVGGPRHVEADEFAQRVDDDWHATIPDAPPGFPGEVPGGMDLRPEEATWLRERILETVPDSLLAHVVASDTAPSGHSPAPWTDPVCHDVDGELARILHHARMFSLCTKGATQLYLVMVAEAYVREGYTRVETTPGQVREYYDQWLHEVAELRAELEAWDVADFWDCVLAHNPRVRFPTRAFVTTWIDAMRSGEIAGAADDTALRSLVHQRELALKGSLARLGGAKQLGSWSGDGRAGDLGYRWRDVRTITRDIRAGLARA